MQKMKLPGLFAGKQRMRLFHIYPGYINNTLR